MEDNQGWTTILLSEKEGSYIPIKNIIAHLIFDGGNPLLYFDSIVPKDFVSKVADTRHYFTHYDEKKKDKIFEKKDILWKTAELTYLLEYHILKLLGFDAEWLNNKIGDKYSRLKTRYDIHNSTLKVEKI